MAASPGRVKAGIHFATPCYGSQIFRPCFESYWQLRETLLRNNIEHELNLGYRESLITRARSEMARTFLVESDLDRLMWIDADIEFTPDDVAKLWNLDADVAVGIYPQKFLPVVYAVWVNGKQDPDLDALPNPCEVDFAGTGFMMIKRRALERMIEAHPELEYRGVNGPTYHLFGEMLTEGHHLSEDYAFCHRWRALGGTILADTSVRLVHHGLYAYGGKNGANPNH